MENIRRCLFTAFMVVFAVLFVLPGTAKADATEYYISAEGDTLAGLATASGIDASLLMLANDLDSTGVLESGTLLVLPIEPLQAVTIASGDTLWSVSREYGVSLSELRAYNEISDERCLYPGMTVYVPLPEEQAAVSGEMEAEYPAVTALASRGASFNWPVDGVISSRYGPRDGEFHYGLDIAADSGTPIAAALNGVVIEADWKNDAYGYAVMLQHNNGLQTLYGHASKLLVQPGDRIRLGETVALVGSTGNSTGPHVHFEIRVGGACVDPLEYLR